jgi:hypothetical protein
VAKQIRNQSKMLSKAIAIAAKGHENTLDDGGSAYILHTLRVMNGVLGNDAPDYELGQIAVMHDYIEGCFGLLSEDEIVGHLDLLLPVNGENSRQLIMEDLKKAEELKIANAIQGLRVKGFSERVLSTLNLLTHRPWVDYDQYIESLSENSDAIKCKMSEIGDNSDITRLNGTLTIKNDSKEYKQSMMLSRAIAIASEGHMNVLDRGGEAYIIHPLRVMNSVTSKDDPDHEMAQIAVLHDYIEDCCGLLSKKEISIYLEELGTLQESIKDRDETLDLIKSFEEIKIANTLKELKNSGFSERVISALDILTHRCWVEYKDYIDEIANNIDTIKCKMGDIHDNSKVTRLKGVREKDLARIIKYSKAYAKLKSIKHARFPSRPPEKVANSEVNIDFDEKAEILHNDDLERVVKYSKAYARLSEVKKESMINGLVSSVSKIKKRSP